MLKNGIIALVTLTLSFLVAAGIVYGQTASPSPTASPSATASPTTNTTVPSGAPSTGMAD